MKVVSIWLVVLIGLLVLPHMAEAQSSGRYVLEWSTIGGGGGTSSGGQYIVTGTIGQAEAGRSAGGGYEVLGGFWSGGPLCRVEFHHYASFAEYWLDSGCDAGNDWCGGADMDELGDVDLADLKLFVNEWLYYCPYDWPLR
jgi:hypothetical protein